jgi:SAM-dependent methyltransferase
MMLGAGPNLTPFPNSIILRDGHCHNHGRLPARDPIYLAPTLTVNAGFGDVAELSGFASKRAVDTFIPASLLRASADHLPFADSVFDTIVMTWTLCSIPNPIRALTEIRRVLKPGGRLRFVEHGLPPEISTARWQHRLTPYG